MVPKLIVYGGAREIGGNKIFLEDGDVRLWLDFGTPFSRYRSFFNEYLRPRSTRGLWDLLALGLLPPLYGLYREDLAPPRLWERFEGKNLKRDHGPAVDAVLITHAHLDHMGDIAFLDPDIPLVMSPMTAAVARAMQVTSTSGFTHEWCYLTKRVWDEGSGTLQVEKRAPYHGRRFDLLADSVPPELQTWWLHPLGRSRGLNGSPPEPFSGRVSDRRVCWWPVDHSIPGAVAFAVETRAGWMAYTGDLRFHGREQAVSERLQADWEQMGIAVLLCEGTRLGESTRITEGQVYENALELTDRAEGRLVVADFAPRNLERFQTFLEVARQTRRCLVIQPRDAYLLEAISRVSPTFREILDGSRDNSQICLLNDPKARPNPWEQDLRERWRNRMVKLSQISKDPGAYLLCCSLLDMNDLLDIDPASLEGGLYLYANSRAYDEEQAVDLERLRQWVRHLGMRMEGDPDDPHARPLHASGHAGEDELAAFVRAVRPRVLVPVHAERPERWQEILRGTNIQVQIPEPGQEIQIG